MDSLISGNGRISRAAIAAAFAAMSAAAGGVHAVRLPGTPPSANRRPNGSNARTQRAARKRRNVLRNRKAHRG